MKIGNRIVYDQDGEIVFQTGEMQGDVLPHKELTSLNFIDIGFGEVDYTAFNVIGVNPESKEVILEATNAPLTPEQQIKELEDALLLAADAESGGIL